MKQLFRYRNQTYEIDLQPNGTSFSGRVEEQEFEAQVQQIGSGELVIEMEGQRHVLHSAVDRNAIWVSFQGRTFRLERSAGQGGRAGAGEADTEGILRAPMPGQVREVRAQVGDAVGQGETLLILEAMKMEIRIQAPVAGKVVEARVSAGDQVDRDQVLLEIAP